MARCNSCSKLCGYNEDDYSPECEDWEINDGVLTGSIHISLTSACCGDEVKTGDIDAEATLPEFHEDGCAKDGEYDINVELESATWREGKGRGVKTFYGATCTAEITCNECEASVTLDPFEARIQASYMDDV